MVCVVLFCKEGIYYSGHGWCHGWWSWVFVFIVVYGVCVDTCCVICLLTVIVSSLGVVLLGSVMGVVTLDHKLTYKSL